MFFRSFFSSLASRTVHTMQSHAVNDEYIRKFLPPFTVSHFLELVWVVVPAEEQVASTDNRFNMLGHGSVPKLVFDMVTKQLSRPMHFCET
jgi:hypothetical protein